MHNARIICERYEGLSEIRNCMKCEHVTVCTNYGEHLEGEVSMIRQRDYV